MDQSWLVDHKYIGLTKEIIDNYRENNSKAALKFCRELGIKALAITNGNDTNTNTWILPEHNKAKNYGI